MDAGLKGGVDVLNTVGSEEEDAFVVFENAKEDFRLDEWLVWRFECYFGKDRRGCRV